MAELVGLLAVLIGAVVDVKDVGASICDKSDVTGRLSFVLIRDNSFRIDSTSLSR